MDLVFTKRALRDLRRINRSQQLRIINKLEDYAARPDSLKHAERLTNQEFGQWRFRIGDYRVLGDVDGQRFIALRIGHRRDIYR